METTVTLAAIISAIALLSSILSPVLVALINNRHLRKTAELNFYVQHRAEAIENYLSAAGEAIHDPSDKALPNYGKYAGEIYFHIPERLWYQVDQITLALQTDDLDNARGHFRTLCKELAVHPPRGKKQRRSHRNVQK